MVQAVEGEHPRTASERTLAGFSMGAHGALNVGLHHPELFRSLIGISGYHEVDDPEGVYDGDEEVEEVITPEGLGRPGGPTLHHLDPPLRVALVQGDDESDLIDGSGEHMPRALRGNGVAVVAQERDGDHDWGFVADQWPTLTPRACPWRSPWRT